MIRIKKQKVLYDWGSLLDVYFFFWQYCQESYLEPNQKSMVECFCKNNNQILVVNNFRQKAPSQMFDWVSIVTSEE